MWQFWRTSSDSKVRVFVGALIWDLPAGEGGYYQMCNLLHILRLHGSGQAETSRPRWFKALYMTENKDRYR
jgi:hypothetical protein